MTDQSSHRLPRNVVPERYRIELVPDLVTATFAGHSDVAVRIEEATSVVVCNAAELEISAITALGVDGEALSASIALDADAGRVTATFDEALAPGPWQLTYEFSGALNDRLHGFYRSTYTGSDGTVRTIATTQFEPTDARLAFPCWDEPDFKATFEVTLVVDDGLVALSNSAVADEEVTGEGKRRVRFAETMVMSTYLVAFIVGEFEMTPAADVRGVPVRIVAPPGRLHLAPFAMDAAEFAVNFLSDYFGLPYPSDKLDHVAIPDFAAGAMENLGCVTYRESGLLLDRERASQLELRRVATVVAHETAHMWFGDLVTMKWWNGIWLNEAFATFMELTTNAAWHPEWDVWTAFGGGKSAALGVDSLRATRPVEYPVGDPVEAEAMFDLLTYFKGASVLRMLEQYLEPETFRQGIGGYLSKHRHANTETSDLWDALEEASGEPVRSIMESWIFQGGHPVVDVSLEDGALQLSQRRFTFDGKDEGERWSIPLTVRTSEGGKVALRRHLLDGASTVMELDGPLDWVVANDGASGFYRVHYSHELLGQLLDAGITEMTPSERIGLLTDTWAGVVGATTELADWVRLVSSLGAEDDPDVWAAALGPIGLLELVADDNSLPAVQAFTRRIAGPSLARLGWDARDGEPERLAITRARLVTALGTTGADADVRAEATARHGGSGNLAPDLRNAVTHVVVAAGGAPAWEAVRQAYVDADTPQESERSLYALPSATDRELLLRTLDYSISDEVRNQNGGFVVAMVLGNRAAGEAAWDWVEAHWSTLIERYRAALLIRMLDGIASLVEPSLAARVDAFIRSAELEIGPQPIEQTLERLSINSAFAARWREGLAEALAG